MEESKYCHAVFCLCPQGRAHHTQIGYILYSPQITLLCRLPSTTGPMGVHNYSWSLLFSKYRMRKCRTCGQCRGHVDCLRGRGEEGECGDCSKISTKQAMEKAAGDTKTMLADSSRKSNAAVLQTISTKIPVLTIKKLNSKDISLINSSIANSQ